MKRLVGYINGPSDIKNHDDKDLQDFTKNYYDYRGWIWDINARNNLSKLNVYNDVVDYNNHKEEYDNYKKQLVQDVDEFLDKNPQYYLSKKTLRGYEDFYKNHEFEILEFLESLAIENDSAGNIEIKCENCISEEATNLIKEYIGIGKCPSCNGEDVELFKIKYT